jgi:hypothetical protein
VQFMRGTCQVFRAGHSLEDAQRVEWWSATQSRNNKGGQRDENAGLATRQKVLFIMPAGLIRRPVKTLLT